MAKNIFNSIKLTKPKSNMFDLTHDVKLSCDMGNLIPVCVMECIPGDKFNLSAEALIRFAPMVAPVMHRFNVSIHYFFVPNRIVWPNWEKFITGNDDEVQFPTLVYGVSQYNANPLIDYMGLNRPNGGIPDRVIKVNALPFAAYQAIYHEYYRDQNLIPEFNYKLQDGNNTVDEFIKLRKRAWEHDYFTSALPFAQKGATVDIPLGDVTLKTNWDDEGSPRFRSEFDNQPKDGDVNSNVNPPYITVPDGDAFKQAYDPDGTLEVQPTTITDLRRAFKLQEWLEKNARAGTRYVESILAHFGVRSSDARLQRPEYITGVKSPIVISEVLNTTGEDAGLPQGNMAGHGVGVAQGKFGSYFCEEHGYIIGVMSIMPMTAYQQGTPKHFMKYEDRFQFYWPEFAHIGEQEVYEEEVYDIGTGTGNPVRNVFGYVPRYAEYRFVPNRVAGDFRNSLNYWHMGRIFSTAPALNQEFIECNPGKRIFAVTDENTDSLYCHVLNKVTAWRPIPKFGNPMM